MAVINTVCLKIRPRIFKQRLTSLPSAKALKSLKIDLSASSMKDFRVKIAAKADMTEGKGKKKQTNAQFKTLIAHL